MLLRMNSHMLKARISVGRVYSSIARPFQVPAGNMKFVQSLRGIAALWVVLFHLEQGHHIDNLLSRIPNFIKNVAFEWGHYGVAIFFALSGFVIAHSLRNSDVTAKFFGKFVVRRSIRLDPPYWGAILLAIGVKIVSEKVGHSTGALPSVRTIVMHLFYAQEFQRLPEINPVFWTLTYEVQFYIVIAFGLFLSRPITKGGTNIRAQLILISSFIAAVLGASGFHYPSIPGLFVDLWFAFFVGSLAYWSLSIPVIRLLFLALILIIITSLNRENFPFGIVSAATALCLFFAGTTNWLMNGLKNKILLFLGSISYSLYLLHNPIIGMTEFLIVKFLGNGVLANIMGLLSGLSTTLLGSTLYFLVVERRVHRLTRRITTRRGNIGPAGDDESGAILVPRSGFANSDIAVFHSPAI